MFHRKNEPVEVPISYAVLKDSFLAIHLLGISSSKLQIKASINGVVDNTIRAVHTGPLEKGLWHPMYTKLLLS